MGYVNRALKENELRPFVDALARRIASFPGTRSLTRRPLSPPPGRTWCRACSTRRTDLSRGLMPRRRSPACSASSSSGYGRESSNSTRTTQHARADQRRCSAWSLNIRRRSARPIRRRRFLRLMGSRSSRCRTGGARPDEEPWQCRSSQYDASGQAGDGQRLTARGVQPRMDAEQLGSRRAIVAARRGLDRARSQRSWLSTVSTSAGSARSRQSPRTFAYRTIPPRSITNAAAAGRTQWPAALCSS